jgi:hypothetical protein
VSLDKKLVGAHSSTRYEIALPHSVRPVPDQLRQVLIRPDIVIIVVQRKRADSKHTV